VNQQARLVCQDWAEEQTRIVDGAKLDTARDSANVGPNRKERSLDQHGPPQKRQKTQTSHYEHSPLERFLRNSYL